MRNFNDKRVMFDTNILFDAVMPDRGHEVEAHKALRICNGGGWMGLVTAGSLKDFYYTFAKYYGKERARKAVGYFMKLLVITPTSGEESQMALFGDEPDFEDGLVRACAELNDAEYILSRDEDAFAYSKIKKIDCAQFVELVERQSKIDYKTLLGEG